MNMRYLNLGAGRAVAGVVTVVAACAPMSVDLEHAGSGGASGSAGMNTTGGDSPGTTVGDKAGSAGRDITAGAGAPSGNAGKPGHVGGSDGSSTSSGSGGSGGDRMASNEAGAGGEGATCGQGVLSDVQNGHDLLPGYHATVDPRVMTWLAEMSLSDKITEMAGVPVGSMNYQDISRTEDLPLSDGSTIIRGFLYRGGARGVNLEPGQTTRVEDGNDFGTAFPAVSIRGAAWDLDLEWQLGDAIGDETTASKNNLLIGPSANVLRHPYWGQAQNAYGEDVYQVGRMGTAFVAGVQQHIAACAHDFMASEVEKERSTGNALVDEQTLREIYARPLEMFVTDGGVACVMTAYGLLNNVSKSENSHLLRDILKAPVDAGGFGFHGFVMSEWWSAPGDQTVPDAVTAEVTAGELANGGLDIEQPWILNYGQLAGAVQQNSVAPTVIDDAVSRILEQKARFKNALVTDGFGLVPSTSTLNSGSIATNDAHLALAEQAEVEAAVLLANGSTKSPVLPVPSSVGSIAVIGADVDFSLVSSWVPKSCGPSTERDCTFHFASDVALGDQGTNAVNADPAQSIGPFAGIQAAAATHGDIAVTQGNSVSAAADADLVVVVVGLTPGDEGEEYTIMSGGDRTTLTLPGSQVELVDDALALMKPTVIVIESGSVVDVPWLSHKNQNQATVWAGYGGMRGGAALGKLLFGDANFSGKLPLAWATESALPVFKTDDSTVTLSYLFGYRAYDQQVANGQQPDVVFPFGHGLSYTTFAYSNAAVPCGEVTDGAVLDVTVNVENTGNVSGDEVAFLFVAGPQTSNEPRPVKQLGSFARVSLAPGAKQVVHLPLRSHDLRHWSDAQSGWTLDVGEYTVLVGPSGATDALQTAGTFTVPG